ncbi:hypothetical protein HJC23_007604 [Cyclotella cryptica]|uniref:Exportin-1/Importin-beta-like domain-containing protein n=1 Tax=Cyclotella cryptica TaxID=29204 RepID=A0ABD3QQY5_9STRA|eukprot:CCRYP_002884-RD/>CCRYP_002884-RD protein AED:0.34 eAED:0.34 QI:236/1/1/1/0.66/0.5/10/1208/1134
MSHALNALDHALRGDPSGLSFLEQTASIYVLDATKPGHPTTFGWWNFLNDALNEVERYEEGTASNNPAYASTTSAYPTSNRNVNPLDPHVRLLATITRRIARRPPSSDRRLIGTCLANASMTHMQLLANPETSRSLLQNNDHLREMDMGRIAAIVFDYSFHGKRRNDNMIHSAFSDAVAMEQLCGVIAANAVSTGPNAVRHLVSNWIVPSCESLPSLSVAAILSQVAMETMGKSCPLGVRAVVKDCVSSVFVKALGPLLVESLRESEEGVDEGDRTMLDAGENWNHRTAAIALKAFDAWCKATSVGAVQLQHIFASTNINVLEAIADALYANSERVIDGVSDLIDTLLKIDSLGNNLSPGLSIAQEIMSSALSSNNLFLAQQVVGENVKARLSILAEFISAVGLQRLRFSERQAKGDIAVCRCLTRTGARVLLESKDFISNGSLDVSLDGLLDLLFKSVLHPSVDICGIALEAFSGIAPSNNEISTRLLPYLQGKAIIPVQLRNDAQGYEDFVDFRNQFLIDALVACYTGCSAFYLQSCSAAVEEFCQATVSPHLPHQLEAALFCLVAVSDKATNATDKHSLNHHLEKVVAALKRNSFTTTSNPLVMAQMCRFIKGYALSLSRCQQTHVFEIASELALTSFNMSVIEYNKSSTIHAPCSLSPLSEASNALQKLLISAPSRFSAPTAMSALESAWKMPYHGKQIVIEDREMLCSGLCVVVASLPTDQWGAALYQLTQPIISCLIVAAKEADEKINERASILQRMANEVLLLAAVVRYFVRTEVPSRFDLLSDLLQKSWQVLTFIGTTYSTEEAIADSLGQLLKDSLSLYRSNNALSLLQEICSLARTVATKNLVSLPSFLSFVQSLIEIHGAKAEISTGFDNESAIIRGIIRQLMIVSYESVMSFSATREQQTSSSPQDYGAAPDIMSPMFNTLTTCAKHCPIFLLSVARDGREAGELVVSSVQASPGMLKAAEVEVSSSTIDFLIVLISKLNAVKLDHLDAEERKILASIVDKTNQIIRTDVVSSSVAAICGMAPQTVLAPLADLLQTLLKYSRWEDVEDQLASALTPYQFKLGNECKSVVIEVFRRCAEGSYPSSNFGDLIHDVWELHQTDDTDATAGGQVVHDFMTKYRSNR